MTPRSLCPRCHVNRRAVQDSIEAGRDDRKHYAAYCEPCLIEEGYVLREEERDVFEIHGRRVMKLSWWAKPVTPAQRAEVYAEPIDDLFARLNRPRETDIEAAHSRTPRTPSALRLAPRKR